MAVLELSEAEWQRSFVPVLRLAGPSISTPGGDADPRAREHAVGDVKHVMDKTIGKRCCRISGAVSASNYLEVPRDARMLPLNLTERFVYIQVRPIGNKAMTFHLDVLDGGGKSARATFSTLYSEPPCAVAAEPSVLTAGSTGRGKTLGGSKHANGTAGAGGAGTAVAVPWKGGAGSGGGCAESVSPAALVRRGGAVRFPISFDTSRSHGWTVVAVDMVNLMRKGRGKGYKALRGVRLGANMVVRGVYVSDCVYSPRALPKEMTFRVPGGVDWEEAYGWEWIPEVPDENAAPPPPPPLQDSARSTRPAWPPGASSPTPSVAAVNAAEAHGRRRMEKRHFRTSSGSALGKLLAHNAGDDDGDGDEAVAVVTRNRHAAGLPSPRLAPGGPPVNGRANDAVKTQFAGPAGGDAPASLSWREKASLSWRKNAPISRRKNNASASPVKGARSKSVGAGRPSHASSNSTPAANAIATPRRTRVVRASLADASAAGASAAATAATTPQSKTPTRLLRQRGHPPPSPITSSGRPPLSPKTCRRVKDTPPSRFRKKKTFFCDGDDVGNGNDTAAGGASDVRVASWTRRELEEWAAGDPAPPTPSVAVVGDAGVAGRSGGDTRGGPDPPVVTRVLPPGVETSRPEPPEFEPDPALRLERAVCYTGGLPGTLAFLGGAALVAFPCNNVIVLMETPVMPEPFRRVGENVGESLGGNIFGGVNQGAEEEKDEDLFPAPHVFLRGHTDRVTLLHVSNAGHLLASAQGDTLGAAGGHGIVRIWDASSFERGHGNVGVTGSGGRGRGGKCVAHFEGHRWGVASMCFSSDDRLLCTVGGDEHRRTQVVVWDVGILCAARAGTVHGAAVRRAVVARQISDFPITRILFSPFEKLRLVSCGRENVRFWRIRRGHLPACPAVLNDFARDLECTDLAFQRDCHGIAGAERGVDWTDRPSVVYVSSRAGTVLQVSYRTRNLLCVLRLHDGPILSLTVTESCAVTCSADKLLRLWPLDFSDFLMEAAHESAVTSACSSGDGLKLAVGTAEGSIGVLDVMTHGYATALRSHKGSVTAAAIDPCREREEFATASEDCTVRVWDLVTGAQLYQFYSPGDEPTCITYAPPLRRDTLNEGFPSINGVYAEWDGGESDRRLPEEERHLVVGYASGATRVFDVQSTRTLFECQQHGAAVQEVVFTPDGGRVVSAGADGLLCVYDASQGYYAMKVMACDAPEPGQRIRLAVSPGSDRLAVIGTEPSCILLYDLASMVLKGRLGKSGRKGCSSLGVYSNGGGGGGTAALPRPYRPRSSGAITAGGDAFLHAGFSGDGAELLAFTATKLFRFPLGGGDGHAWSTLLPCKAGPAVAVCYPPSGPGLVLVSPAPAVNVGATDFASQGFGGSKRGTASRIPVSGGTGLSPSELFLSRVHRDERSASVVMSVPQAFAAHASPLTAAAFSSTGDRLVTCDGTGVVLLWTNLAAPQQEAWATPLRVPGVETAAAADNGMPRSSGRVGPLFGGEYGDEDLEAEKAEAAEAAVEATAAAAVSVRPLVFSESDGQSVGDGTIPGDAIYATSARRVFSASLDAMAPNYAIGGAGETKWKEMATEARETVSTRAPTGATAWTPRGKVNAAVGLPPLPPETPTGWRGQGDGFAQMIDQTPPPTGVAARGRFDSAESGTLRAEGMEGGPRASGQHAKALATLQTAVEEAAVAVGESEEEKEAKEEQKQGQGAKRPEAESPNRCPGSSRGRTPVGADGQCSIYCNIRETERFNKTLFESEDSTVTATEKGDDGAKCVTWRPSSGQLFYAQGGTLFAEELDSCRRRVLFDGNGGPGYQTDTVVAVSGCGEYVARASRQSETNVEGGDGGRLSIWCLARHDRASNESCGDSDRGNGFSLESVTNHAMPTTAVVLDAHEDDGIVALAFSPSTAELCSLGKWNGSRCLLKTRPLSAPSSAGTIAGVPALASRAVTSVTPLAAKTSAICVLAGQDEGRGFVQPYLFATGGEEGVALWRRVLGSTASVAGISNGPADGGVRLLGASAGVRATALTSVGRFVVAAEVLGAAGRVSVTAIDVTWLAAGGYHAATASKTLGVQGLVGDEEFAWQAFGGSDDISITCLATAGPRWVAVGGSGGKLEIWDVEAVCGRGTGAGARATPVCRLDLCEALGGASVTDMTWDSGGTDAVLGAGGRIYHLHVPREEGSTPSARRRAVEPTLARVWPGGDVQTRP